jgi:hypothetical protein
LNAVDLGCRWMLVVVLALAALGKARGRRPFEDFIQTLAGFGFPRALAGAPLAVAVIAAEALSALLLLALPLAGYGAALLLLGGFTVGLVRVWRRGEAVSCRCFGASHTPVGVAHVVRNGLLLAVLVLGAVAHQAGAGRSLAVELSVLAGALGALAGFFVTRWDDLVFLLVDPQPASGRSAAMKKSRQ